MPSSIFSHQAPGLILKVKYPKKFDGTALCLGTFIPDLNSIVEFILPVNLRGITHSLIGQIIWTIPIGIIATIIFCRFIAPISANIASRKSWLYEGLKYFGIDEWHHLKTKKFNKRFFIVAAYSALLGGITHILLDWPSHSDVQFLYPWIIWPNPEFLMYSIVDFGIISIGPLVIHADLTVYNLIWWIESFILIVICLYYLRYIKKKDLIKTWYNKN